MLLLLVLDFIIYTAVIVILHVILKNYLHNNIYSIEGLPTGITQSTYEAEINSDGGENQDGDDEASWDEISIQHKVINKDKTMYTDKETDSYMIQPTQPKMDESMFILNDRKLFNSHNNNSKHLTQKGMWEQYSNQSELLQNDSSNTLENQYVSYWNDVKDEKICSQSYDSIVNLRTKEMETYFDQKQVNHIDIKDINKQKLLDINNRIAPTITTNNIDPKHASKVNENNSVNSNNTLDFKALDNNSIYDKHNILEKQYSTLKQPIDTASFLKMEQVEKIKLNNEDVSDDREYKLKKNDIELSDVRHNNIQLSDTRNTFAINHNSPLIKQDEVVEAFEDTGNMATI